jgi:UDP-N-acetylmuramate dehydrogenase
MHCVDHNWGGIENLSLIPGTVGASPMQNIGAYGVEIKDVFEELEALRISDLQLEKFDKETCQFGYRESIFKHSHKNGYVITSVTYRLSKKDHALKTGYGAIQDELQQMGVLEPTIKDISNAVIAIRRSKLPDPKEIGNAGSFFKNPVVPISVLQEIRKKYEQVPNYPAGEGSVKLAAGWLIEQAGWKGFREGDHGVHAKQALVLVNYGSANGYEIMDLAQRIILDVKNKFQVELSNEVNFF